MKQSKEINIPLEYACLAFPEAVSSSRARQLRSLTSSKPVEGNGLSRIFIVKYQNDKFRTLGPNSPITRMKKNKY